MFNKPFFYVVFTGEIKKADTFNKCLKKLKMRAEYLRFFIIYNFKAENLYLVNKVLFFF